MDNIRRGQMWWWKCPYSDREYVQTGTRPIVIISNNSCNTHSDVVTVLPCTSKIKNAYPERVPVVYDEQLSIVLADQITSINTSELIGYIGELKPFQMKQVDEAVLLQLGFKGRENGTNQAQSHSSNQL